jgi:hypothetical protein
VLDDAEQAHPHLPFVPRGGRTVPDGVSTVGECYGWGRSRAAAGG